MCDDWRKMYPNYIEHKNIHIVNYVKSKDSIVKEFDKMFTKSYESTMEKNAQRMRFMRKHGYYCTEYSDIHWNRFKTIKNNKLIFKWNILYF